jgi:response regulator RpfG family c-di-GMP phosphodiesterase
VKKLLIVDDDSSMRGLMRMRLSDTYEIFDTEDPEQALALALEHKPDAVLMDLMMPKFSGFELCQSFHSLSYTSYLPIFVITGEAGTKYREHCASLGATGYFEKPIDFKKLKERLAIELETSRPERRSEVRVRMKVVLKLRGTDANGKKFEELAETENVSASGFLCNCALPLVKDALLEVFLAREKELYVGRARVVRKDSPGASWQRYGFHFEETTAEWVLQKP